MNEEIHDENSYLVFVSQKKQFIMQHLLKIFYYWNLDESNNLSNPEWTKQHWMNEIVDIINLARYQLNVINNSSALFDALYINPDYNKNIVYLKSLMSKSYDFEAHRLPIISDRKLRSKWVAFTVAYKKFINAVVNRLTYENSYISRSMIFDFWLSMAKKCSKSESKMEKVSKKYANFTELTRRLQLILESSN